MPRGSGSTRRHGSTAKSLEALAADEAIKEQIAQARRVASGSSPRTAKRCCGSPRDVAATGDDLAATRKVLAHKRLLRSPFALCSSLTVGLVGLALALGDDVMRWLRGGARPGDDRLRRRRRARRRSVSDALVGELAWPRRASAGDPSRRT